MMNIYFPDPALYKNHQFGKCLKSNRPNITKTLDSKVIVASVYDEYILSSPCAV